jgi:CheY-like chemotaxis protein
MLLTIWGHQAEAHYNGCSALQAAREQPPLAVFLDIVMPRMEGFRFTTLFRDLPGCANVPVIGITGRSDFLTDPRSRQAGIDWMLLKPVLPQRIEWLVQGLLPLENGPRRSTLPIALAVSRGQGHQRGIERERLRLPERSQRPELTKQG